MDEKQNTVDTLDAPDEALSPTAGSPLSAVRPIARLPALTETVRRQVRASISCRSCANRYLPTIQVLRGTLRIEADANLPRAPAPARAGQLKGSPRCGDIQLHAGHRTTGMLAPIDRSPYVIVQVSARTFISGKQKRPGVGRSVVWAANAYF